MTLPLEARLALEWFNASGERTSERLRSLVDHFCTTNAINEPETRRAIYDAAFTAAVRNKRMARRPLPPVGSHEWKSFVADAIAKAPADRTTQEAEQIRIAIWGTTPKNGDQNVADNPARSD